MQNNLSSRVRYRFDNLMSSGPIALIATLALLSIILVVTAAVVVSLTDFSPAESESLGFVEAAWASLMRTLDPGTMGGDTGWGFRLTMLGVTLGGIFIVSTLIGVLSNGISNKLEELRKGRSHVIETGHTLILNWSDKIFPVIKELIVANENQKKPRIVILSDKDKVEMEDEIKLKITEFKNTKIICRNGNPLEMTDLEIVNPDDAKSIIILSENEKDPDIHVIKTLLAIINNPQRKQEKYNIVAEICDHKNKDVAEMVGGDEVTIVHSEDLISRLIAQTCRQSGLSIVYNELLDFDGSEIYFREEPKLEGMNFKECIESYNDSTIIGLLKNDKAYVNPPMDMKFDKGDKIIAISEDDDTIIMNSSKSILNENAILLNGKFDAVKEKTLILGWNKKASIVVKELDNYSTPGSELNIIADHPDAESHIKGLTNELKNFTVKFSQGHISDRNVLEKLNITEYNHIIILCYYDIMEHEDADSITLICLLHLRNISEKLGVHVSIVSEILDINNKELAEVTKADDFIISNQLISLMLSQLSENKKLKHVFDDLFDPEGSEIYLKPASGYIKEGEEVNFYTVTEAAARKNEVAIGYRQNKYRFDEDKQYGVVVNPKKSDKITFEKGDKVIVLAEE